MNKSGIHIKKANRGKFTSWAKSHGMGVQEAASHVMANKGNYSPTVVKRANFAKNASKWHHADGGSIKGYATGGRVEKASLSDNDPNKVNPDVAYVVRTKGGDYPVFYKGTDSAKRWNQEYTENASKGVGRYKSNVTGLEYATSSLVAKQQKQDQLKQEISGKDESTGPVGADQPIQKRIDQINRTEEYRAMDKANRNKLLAEAYQPEAELTGKEKIKEGIQAFYNYGSLASDVAFIAKPNPYTGTAFAAMHLGKVITDIAENPESAKEILISQGKDVGVTLAMLLANKYLKNKFGKKQPAKETLQLPEGKPAPRLNQYIPKTGKTTPRTTGIKYDMPEQTPAGYLQGGNRQIYLPESSTTKPIQEASGQYKMPLYRGGGIHKKRGALRMMQIKRKLTN